MKLLVKSSWWRSLVTRKRVRTIDRAAGDFHTPLQIGPKRHMTREGFLLCVDVPIGRTGELLYAPGEVPVGPGDNGLIRISRDAAALFDPDTIASFNGKPVTDDHPPGMEVTPENHERYTKGFTVNARRGDGADSDCIVADLMILDRALIRKILAGKVEVSSGYSADYEDNGGGFGRQIAILGNHVALVEKGRCGPRCAIGDHDSTEGEEEMTTPVKQAAPKPRAKLLASTLRSMLTADEAGELAEQLAGDDAGAPVEGATHIHFHSNGGTLSPVGAEGGPASKTGTSTGDERMDKLEKIVGDMGATLKTVGDSVAEIMKKFSGPGGDNATTEEEGKKTADEGKEDDKDDKSKTGDSSALATSYTKLTQDCEILVPGFRVPTLDHKAKRAATVDNMCAIRRNALGLFAMAPGGAQVISVASGDANFNVQTADCALVAEAFSGAVMAKRMSNNAAVTGDAATVAKSLNTSVSVSTSGAPAALTPAELNKRNQEYWAKQGVTKQ